MSEAQTSAQPSRDRLIAEGRRAARRMCEQAFASIEAALQIAQTAELAQIAEALERFEKDGLCPGFPIAGRAN